MIETSLPKWVARLDAQRPHGFHDLIQVVNSHFRVTEQAAKVLGPYNARQRNTGSIYVPPDKDMLRQLIKQGGMNDFSYQSMLTSLVRFCETTKGMRGLPEPHPSTIHSIQLPAFGLSAGPAGSTMVELSCSAEPIQVKGLRNANTIKFIIVRPKLSKLGTASANNWEVLFFDQAHGYIPDWVDSHLNPRYSGIY